MTQTRTVDRLVAETHAERARLVDLVDALSPQQWATPSLCEGWGVREVVAHVTMPYRAGPGSFLLGMARARFDFNRYADRDARATTAQRSDEWLVELWRRNIEHPWRPPGGGAVGALSHDLIHGLDITVPLGLPGPPSERITMVLQASGDRNVAHFGVDLTGVRLVAVDADIDVGEGSRIVRLPVSELLLVLAGRRNLTDVVGGA